MHKQRGPKLYNDIKRILNIFSSGSLQKGGFQSTEKSIEKTARIIQNTKLNDGLKAVRDNVIH